MFQAGGAALRHAITPSVDVRYIPYLQASQTGSAPAGVGPAFGL